MCPARIELFSSFLKVFSWKPTTKKDVEAMFPSRIVAHETADEKLPGRIVALHMEFLYVNDQELR